jgi:hypothetical protein
MHYILIIITITDVAEIKDVRLVLLVFKATFNNMLVISWISVLLMEETRVPGEKHRPATSDSQT